MDQIAAHAQLGIGSLYRHFPNKQALLSAIVVERFSAMCDLARTAELISDSRRSFEAILTSYLEAAEGDVGFQFAMLGSNDLEWTGIRPQKAEFEEVVTRIITRAVAEGTVRADLTYDDFPAMTCGVMSTMYFKPSGSDWRRHLTLLLEGLK